MTKVANITNHNATQTDFDDDENIKNDGQWHFKKHLVYKKMKNQQRDSSK